MAPLERTLRAALAGTSEAAPRPMAALELPMKLDKLIPPHVFKKLRPACVLVPARAARSVRSSGVMNLV